MATVVEDMVEFIGSSNAASVFGAVVLEGTDGVVLNLGLNPRRISRVALARRMVVPPPEPPASLFIYDMWFFRDNKLASCTQLISRVVDVQGGDLVTRIRDEVGLTRECAHCVIQCGCCSL